MKLAEAYERVEQLNPNASAEMFFVDADGIRHNIQRIEKTDDGSEVLLMQDA